MRKFLHAILALLTLVCCTPKDGGQLPPATLKKEVKKDKQNVEIPKITYSEFLDKVYDFEKDETLKWKNKSGRPIVIDFYATWCMPCKELAPNLEKLAAEYKGIVDFYKVDVQEEDKLQIAFNVKTLPTVMFIPKEGEPYFSLGYMSKGEVKAIIKELVKY